MTEMIPGRSVQKMFSCAAKKQQNVVRNCVLVLVYWRG